MRKIHQWLILMLLGILAIITATGIIAACDGMHNVGFNCGTYGIGLLLFGMIAVLSALAYVFETLEAVAKEKEGSERL